MEKICHNSETWKIKFQHKTVEPHQCYTKKERERERERETEFCVTIF